MAASRAGPPSHAVLCAAGDARKVRPLHGPRVGKGMAKDEKPAKSLQAEKREARLAAALRANLKKRKEQARGRAEGRAGGDNSEPR